MPDLKLKNRYVLLDGMRGVAALGIMIFHLWLENFRFFLGVNLFVDFFFVLSGFVLGSTLMVSSVKKFIFMRLLRLYPMLIPVFALTIVIRIVPFISQRVMESTPPLSIAQYIGAFLLLQIFWGVLIPVNTPLWSLSAEWFVNIFAVVFRFKNIANIVIFIGLFFEVAGIYLNHKFALGWGVIYYLIAIGRAVVGFYLGFTLRVMLSKKEYKGSYKRLVLMLLIFVINCYLFAYSDYFIVSAAPVCFFLVREASSLDESHFSMRFRWLCSYLGRISYGIYVWQIPISSLNIPYFLLKHIEIELGKSLSILFIISVTLMIVVLATEASIRFVEIPLRKIALRRFNQTNFNIEENRI